MPAKASKSTRKVGRRGRKPIKLKVGTMVIRGGKRYKVTQRSRVNGKVVVRMRRCAADGSILKKKKVKRSSRK
eukprot:CAMPEP_0202054256 /NCGR_PEP_ID=MMETSP0963-20130614/6589_1 /ASSEMBLY_ACC=CAM_ASM_000494 /TAXON_ID=4773 /ORGANISM="Schizochytrium aggregatum, Strain ATCC28209" /LENGTH=72 /DNA_ID=CAMNT_0048619663 /DNA_START=53 /DNA_END=271 /DNA_ORIENTATION=+